MPLSPKGESISFIKIVRQLSEVRLKVIQLYLEWPADLSLADLRLWILTELKKQGDPLRWAITTINPAQVNESGKQLKIEAVVMIPGTSGLDSDDE